MMKKLAILFNIILFCSVTFGQVQTINVGSSADDGTGETLRSAFQKTNANFSYLDAIKLDSTDVKARISDSLDVARAQLRSDISDSVATVNYDRDSVYNYYIDSLLAKTTDIQDSLGNLTLTDSTISFLDSDGDYLDFKFGDTILSRYEINDPTFNKYIWHYHNEQSVYYESYNGINSQIISLGNSNLLSSADPYLDISGTSFSDTNSIGGGTINFSIKTLFSNPFRFLQTKIESNTTADYVSYNIDTTKFYVEIDEGARREKVFNVYLDSTVVKDVLKTDSIRSGAGRTALTDYVIYPPHAHMFFNDSSRTLALAVDTYQQITNPGDSLFRVRFESNGLLVDGDTIFLVDEHAHYKYNSTFGFTTEAATTVRIAIRNEDGIIMSFAESTTINAVERSITLNGILFDMGGGKIWFEVKTNDGDDVTFVDGSVTVEFYHRIY